VALRKKSEAKLANVAPVVETKRSSTENPLVFISHDTRDADLAEAFGNLLTDASGGILKSFRSSDRKGIAGIEYGQEWYRAIMDKLDDSTDVVALLTTHSVNRPWILYEAGVAKGKLSANDRVLGIALGISLDVAATGPFAQFQNSPDEEDAVTGLVLQLIRRHPQAAPREAAVKLQVKAFRQTVATILKDRKMESTAHVARGDETSVAKFFEEIKVLVRDVPDRVSTELTNDPRIRRMRKRRRFDPLMIEDMLRQPFFDQCPEHAGLPVLMMFSMLRDDHPWLYDLGVQLYRAIECGELKHIDRARKVLIGAIEMARHSPFSLMSGQEEEEVLFALDHVLRDIEPHIRPTKVSAKGAPKEPDKPE
jgi:TIR domain